MPVVTFTDGWAVAEYKAAETVTYSLPDPGEGLECPKPGCQRPKPFENKDGRLECWWCGFTGGWYDFPRRKGQGT